jgi:hypothetical protein
MVQGFGFSMKIRGFTEAELQYVEVIEDTEGTQANPTDQGKPRCN